jgi:hypothetical protein
MLFKELKWTTCGNPDWRHSQPIWRPSTGEKVEVFTWVNEPNSFIEKEFCLQKTPSPEVLDLKRWLDLFELACLIADMEPLMTTHDLTSETSRAG